MNDNRSPSSKTDEEEYDDFKRILFERSFNTPDFKELKESLKLHPVFVYGTLKKGYCNHNGFLGNNQSIYAGEAYTATPLFMMRSNGGFPIVFKDSDTSIEQKKQLMHLFGEIYFVPLNVLCNLDHLENNGIMYKREKKSFFCLDQSYKEQKDQRLLPSIKAWVYIGKPDYWKDRKNLRLCGIRTKMTKKGKQIMGYNF